MKKIIKFLQEDPVVINIIEMSKDLISIDIYKSEISDNDYLTEQEKSSFEENLVLICDKFELEAICVVSYIYLSEDIVSIDMKKIKKVN